MILVQVMAEVKDFVLHLETPRKQYVRKILLRK